MKVGLMEAGFRSGFNDLIRALMHHEGITLTNPIIHTYTRAAISNELENAQVAKMLVGLVSDQTILQNLDWVDDVEQELRQLEEERQATLPPDPYGRLPPPPEAADANKAGAQVNAHAAQQQR